MLADVAWIVLHGGGGGHSEGVVSFEVALGAVVVLLAIVGVLLYAGAFEPPEDPGPDEPGPESGAGD